MGEHMILIALLLLAALLPLAFREADTKQSQVRAYLTAFTIYATILAVTWLCVALPVLILIKG